MDASGEAKGKAPQDRLADWLAEDMAAVNRLIRDRMASRHAPRIPEVTAHLVEAGGKRLRPLLTLATARMLGYDGQDHIKLAATVEFIHTATLLHDDVVDESTLRRGRATANAAFGNPASVLVGDFLYSRAFEMMVDAGDMRIMKTLAEATNVIAEGEVLQLMNMHDASLDEASYLQVIRSKTAKLFEASTRLAAVLAQSSPSIEQACADYGQALGTAYQLIDDVLDYAGDAQALGKNLGDDLREGKVTLPLITAMNRGTAHDKAVIRNAIETGDLQALDQILDIVKRTGALDVARATASAQAVLAVSAAAALPTNEFSGALLALANSLLDRTQ